MTNQHGRSFVFHAKVLSALTFLSRIVGLLREIVAYRAFGADAIYAAFLFAFSIPNLFRKLFGEGALTASFIPRYAKVRAANPDNPKAAQDFAVASVNLLILILGCLTLLGEAILLYIIFNVPLRADYLLAAQLAVIMLPYVLLVCGAAFLGAILQSHGKFVGFGLASTVLNVATILAIIVLGLVFDLKTDAGRTAATYGLAVAVLLAGFLQIMVLVPGLNAIGFRYRPTFWVFTPDIRAMLASSVPVFIGAGVLQIGVFLDKFIAMALARTDTATHFTLAGHTLAYPMAEGAAARLNLAQYLYQFPLAVFATALATAVFPKLAGDALAEDKTAFRAVMKRGIEAALFIGLPASVGLMIVAYPAVQFMFQSGNFTAEDTRLTAISTVIYSAAIWAFSMHQILSRGYYALHDNITPLIWTGINLIINLIVEIPLVFTPLGESGMAVGTLVSFAVQAVAMTWFLSRRVGGLDLKEAAGRIWVMVIASISMGLICLAVSYLPIFPDAGRLSSLSRLLVLMVTGALAYALVCQLCGLPVVGEYLKLLRRKKPAVVAATTAPDADMIPADVVAANPTTPHTTPQSTPPITPQTATPQTASPQTDASSPPAPATFELAPPAEAPPAAPTPPPANPPKPEA